MAKKKGQRAKDIKVAKQRGRVKYGAERATINALLGQAKGGLNTELATADAGTKSAIHFANKARPQVKGVFDAAKTQADTARSDVEAAFGRLGGAAAPFQAATAREQAGRTQRVALAGANALNDLTQRQLEAKAGGQYARSQARAKFNQDFSGLLKKKTDLQQRMGAYVASEAADIAEARAGRKATTRNTRLGIKGREKAADTAYERDVAKIKLRESLKGNAPGAKGLPKGTKPASNAERRGFETDFAKALSYAKNYGTRADARAELIPGAPPGKDAKGNAVPAAPSIGNQLALSVALDMKFDGHVSRLNARRMKEAGMRLKDIPGLTSYTKYEKRRRNQQLASGAS